MPSTLVRTCVRVRDINASLGFTNVYVGLPGDDDRFELTVDVGRKQPYAQGRAAPCRGMIRG